MIQTAVAAFIGAFAALVVMAEIQVKNKLLRYLAAFVVGIILAFLLTLLLTWVAGVFQTVT